MTRATQAKIIQYVGAIAAVLFTVLSDPAVLEFLVSHPWTTAGLLSAPSAVTLVGLAAAALARGTATPVDPSDDVTEPIVLE